MSPRARTALVTLCCLLVAGAVIPAAAAGTAPAGSQAVATPAAAHTTLTIQLQPDGDARWTVRTTVTLSSTNDSQAFADLATRFENGDTDGLGLSAFRRASEEASAAASREMAITQVQRTSRVENGTGVLILSFTWTNFAQQTADGLEVADAFQTTDGTWLPGLASDQTLIMRPPEGYDYETAPKQFENRTIVWEGPREFSEDYFHVVLTGSVTTPPPEQPDSLFWVLLLVAGLALGGGALYLFLREGGPTDGEGVSTSEAEPPAEATEPEAGETGEAGAPAAAGEPGAESAPAEASEPDEAAAGGDTAEEGPDTELLSDEERVEWLLEQNGGRMKQASIVKETGWSNAKVSQLLSAMDDADRIDKLRIGRENLISLPDEDVTDIED
jgi:uncharacterized membrane protein